MERYDVVIIGSGLGGLECATMLSREGFGVCVLEKNPVAGGCLQSFTCRGRLLDTGIHYIGSMDPGQTLHQYFRYFGVLDKLKMRRLDAEAFDVIRIGDREFSYAMGYEQFLRVLCKEFPHESDNIRHYCDGIRKVGRMIDPEYLRQGKISAGGMEYLEVSGSEYIDRMVGDPLLRDVLGGNNVLYGGIRGRTSLYHLAMVNHSNIEGAYRFVDGSQQLADALVGQILCQGGVVRTGCEVVSMKEERGKIARIGLRGGEQLEADWVISDLHPACTFDLLEKTPLVRQALLSRLHALPNSYGMFSLYLLMEPNRFPYFNRNYYIHRTKDVWSGPQGSSYAPILVGAQLSGDNPAYADVVTLLCPMLASEVAAWQGTRPGRRGLEYERFKEKKAGEMLDVVSPLFPGLEESVQSMFATTPLSYADYTGTPEGSAYGIVKDCRNPFVTLVSVRTRIPNLLLTGQNPNAHGVLGVTLTAALTCSELLGMEYLAKKIGNA